jgi:hypothetical protein
MAGNDGHSMQLWPYGQAAGQNQKYFPLGTSKAKVAELTDDQKLENGLTKMLGSRTAAQEYMRDWERRKGWR